MKYLRYAGTAAIAVLLAAVVLTGTSNLDKGNAANASARLEAAIRNAIAAEYAVTGAYPESLDAILSTYGIKPDGKRFKIFYEPVAENLPPELTILDLEAEREAQKR